MTAPKGSLAAAYAELWAQAASPADVFAFLARHPEAPLRDRADVLLVDQRLSWRHGTGRPVEDYFRNYPEIAENDALKLELITEEFNYRDEAGEQPELDEYLGRFPELGELGFSEIVRPGQRSEVLSPTDLICELFAEPEMADALFDALSDSIAVRRRRIAPREQDEVLLLSHCDVFSALPRKVVRRIEAEMTPSDFALGDKLLQQGTPGNSLLVVTEGVVEIETVDESGVRHSISRAGRGHVLGEMSLLSDAPCSADAIARTDVKALSLPAATFHQLVAQHPQICVVLSNLVAARLGGRTRDVLADKTLGGYRVGRRLGRGGMAVVYEATDPATGERIALKMMSHRLVYDEDSADRFQREADIIESLDHANICRMFGRFAAFHTYFIVMEFCDGITVDELLQRRGSLPAAETKKILGQIAAALHHAHETGIAHRDIKPSNVMILRDGTVKLMDFGLAIPLTEDDKDIDGMLVGTPRYMAPEQLLGNRAGREADYFTLGALAYELVTFRPLFSTNDLGELLDQHSTWQPASFAEVCPAADAAIADAFKTSLAKRPAQRQINLAQIATWAAPVDTTLLSIS